MDCEDIQDRIMDGFVEPGRSLPAEVTAHFASCVTCGDFARRQFALDTQLDDHFGAIRLDQSVRSRIALAVGRERRAERAFLLPDVVHLTTCAGATMVCAAALPASPSVVVASGVLLTAVSYVALALVRSAFESMDRGEAGTSG